jgi:phage-related minor tail protein
MAGMGSRTLKLTILGDVDNLKKSLGQANDDVEKSSSGLGDFSKKAGIAFAAAAGAAAIYAGKLLVDGVKAAIEDKAAQDKLATTLENVTGATKGQIKAVEDYITKTSLANGITDDVLRPSLDRLVRSTKDVTKAQELQQLALDISSGTGKDLAVVSEALAKAHDGNFAALKKLGGGIDDSIIKTKDFDAATAALAKTFEGQASKHAETFQGKMDRLTIAFSEAKETVGGYILDALTPLLDSFVNKGIPAITDFANSLGEKLGPAFAQIFKFIRDDLLPIFKTWWKFLFEEVVPAIGAVIGPVLQGLKDAFDKIKKALNDNSEELKPLLELSKKLWEFIRTYLAPLLGGAFKGALEGISTLVATLITGFSDLVGFMSKAYDQAKRVVDLVNNNKDLFGASAGALPFILAKVTGKATGGPVAGGTSYVVGEKGPELFTPSANGFITPNNRLGGTGGNTINITVNGAIDREGTARSIIDVLNNSFYRGTGGANNLQFT